MNIAPKLQMNLHPKDAENLSLVTALNVKVSNDESCITNEESIAENMTIKNGLHNYYNSDNYKVVGIIPCNTELVIIVIGDVNSTIAEIFRYREKGDNQTEVIKCVYKKLAYHKGKIKGAFTYNVENSLIIAIAEYDGNTKMIPLRTINLGNFDDESVYSDVGLENESLSIAPEVYIPSMGETKYIKGNAYKGWYYLFVRFKINSVDYTQWFNFGYPIYIDTLEKYAITKYCYHQKITGMKSEDAFGIVLPEEPEDGYCVGASDYFSNTSDIANETFETVIAFDARNDIYKQYQIGIVCASKSYTKAFRTSDINMPSSHSTKFILNNTALIESSVEEFIIDNYNYYDVKNIINYGNRLYISNYKESNANDDVIANLNNVHLDLVARSIRGSSISYDYAIITKDVIKNHVSQYDGNYYGIRGDIYFDVNPDTVIYVTGSSMTTTGGSSFTRKKAKAKDLLIVPKVTSVDDKSVNAPSFITVRLDIDGITHSFVNTVSISFDSENNENSPVINIICEDYVLNTRVQYINVNNSFNDRKLSKFLIPGEVYNFFIHYVDKYGHCTNGYRINNDFKWNGSNNSGEIVPIPFEYNGTIYYAAFPIDENVSKNGILNVDNLVIYTSKNGNYLYDTGGSPAEVREKFINDFNSFGDAKYENTKWYQISTGFELNDFLPYINNNGDRLFKIPVRKNNLYNTINVFKLSVNVRTIPAGYVGWFISYEKFEPTKRITGLLTRNDFRSQDSIISITDDYYDLNTVNCQKSDLMYFYSGQYDIADSIRLDYNIMRLEGVNVWDKDDICGGDYGQRTSFYKFCHDMNKAQLEVDNATPPRCLAPSEYKLAIADSAADGRMGVGTALQFKDAHGLFDSYIPSKSDRDRIKLYKVTLINATRDIYMSNNKTLIRCTNIMYGYSYNDAYDNLNGVMTYDGCLIYANEGFTFNTGNNVAYRTQLNSRYYPDEVNGKHTYEFNAPFLAYVQTPCIDDHFYESKCFRNEPTGYVFYVKRDDEDLDKANENNKFANGCIVTPANSIDLFQNKQDSSDKFNVKTYTNYRKDLVSVDEFNKTVRRSNIIQDETRINGWRTFPVEAYKNITENKGIITNLVGIGTMLLVHTEHSLFLFSTDNTLTTQDKSIQLSQPDAFEVAYKEVFTSSLGFGGLQDDKAYIVDQFGYIFYNNDFHRFYRFDNGQLAVIDNDIIQWLDKYKPYNVRFGNDKYNNRILIKMTYLIGSNRKDVVISYNYNVKNFISTHDYYFDEAYNTKSKLYMKCDTMVDANCSLHQFIQNDTSYGNFDNGLKSVGVPKTFPAKIGIVINYEYAAIKFLEYITYKLNKLADKADVDYTYSPVEERVTPYSADLLRVYNDQVNTGILDIAIPTEEAKNVFVNYKKPYWELGNWNFSYLRNRISEYSKYGDAYIMSRIFGNYFVVEFTFNNTDNRKVEFEELGYSLTK